MAERHNHAKYRENQARVLKVHWYLKKPSSQKKTAYAKEVVDRCVIFGDSLLWHVDAARLGKNYFLLLLLDVALLQNILRRD